MRCVAFYGFNKKGKIKAVACGKWFCKHCRKMNARLWAWKTKLQIENSTEQYYFWTLTLGSKYTNAKQGFSVLPTLWNGLRMAIQRAIAGDKTKSGFSWAYMAFVEGQPKRSNMPHFHIVTNYKVKGRIKDFAAKHGFGYQATQERITGSRAANYVSKYASKGSEDMPKGFRRCRASRNWAKLPAFEGDKLFIQSRKEGLTEFFVRVHEETGAEIDDLWEQWQFVHELEFVGKSGALA